EDFKGMNKKDLSKYLKGGIQYAQLGTQVGGVNYPNQYNPLYQGMNPNQSFETLTTKPIYNANTGQYQVNLNQPVQQSAGNTPYELPYGNPQIDEAQVRLDQANQMGTDLQNMIGNPNIRQEDRAFASANIEDSFTRRVQSDYQAAQNEAVNAPNTLNPPQQDKTQFFNPYGGYDIPTAAYLLGENIEQGDNLGTIAAAGKVGFGLARNFLSGMGNARRNQFVT